MASRCEAVDILAQGSSIFLENFGGLGQSAESFLNRHEASVRRACCCLKGAMVLILWSFLVCLFVSTEGKGWLGDDGARNLASTCSGSVNFVWSKLMAMFGFLLAAMVFGLVDATLLVCAATPVAMACAAMTCASIFGDGCRGVAQPGLGPVIVASWRFLGGPIAFSSLLRRVLRRLLR